jgi:hypothetical protein
MEVRVEEIRKSECCSVMDQIRVQNLPGHNLKVTRENVLTSDTMLNHVKRFERNNRTGVDDGNSPRLPGGEPQIFRVHHPNSTCSSEGILILPRDCTHYVKSF